jgi:hypothetical protein
VEGNVGCFVQIGHYCDDGPPHPKISNFFSRVSPVCLLESGILALLTAAANDFLGFGLDDIHLW